MQAIWSGVVIADSVDTVIVEGNHYFPAEALKWEFFEPSESKTVCSWKGIASYYDVVVDGERNRDAAWHYPDPLVGAEVVHGRVAFWNGITVVASVTEDSSEPRALAGVDARWKWPLDGRLLHAVRPPHVK